MSTSNDNPRRWIGVRIRDTYEVEDFLGSGAYGWVYRVRHRFLGVQALKILRFVDGEQASDLVGEARILSTLVDPHIVRVFDANMVEADGREWPYLTMEYVPGGPLEACIAERVRLHPLSALKTARQICSGLGAAHRSSPPVVHRDITAGNVLISSYSQHGTPQVKVSDFGLAKSVDPESRMASAAGTLAYLAPEATWGYCTPATDVYAVGVLLYRMLTGLFPFPAPRVSSGGSSALTREAVLRSRRRLPPRPSTLRLGLVNQVDGIVARILAPDASDRYENADTLGHDLDLVIGELSS